MAFDTSSGFIADAVAGCVELIAFLANPLAFVCDVKIREAFFFGGFWIQDLSFE